MANKPPLPKRHYIWLLAERDLGWQGGTIHQLAKETGADVSILLSDIGDIVEVHIGGSEDNTTKDGWYKARFLRVDGFPIDQSGQRWAKCTAFIDGFALPATLKGLRAGKNLRKPDALF